MSIPEASDQEPSPGGASEPAKPKGGRTSFAKLRRELSDDELAAPAVQKLLLDDIDRLENEATSLRDFRDKYHLADKQSAILKEKLTIHVSQEVVHLGCFSVGSASLGYAYNLWNSQPAGWIAIAFGVVLVVAGIAAKVLRK